MTVILNLNAQVVSISSDENIAHIRIPDSQPSRLSKDKSTIPYVNDIMKSVNIFKSLWGDIEGLK